MLHNKLKNIPLSYLYRRSLELGNNDPKFIALGMSGALLFELYGRERNFGDVVAEVSSFTV